MDGPNDTRFCARCGTMLERREVFGRERGVCPTCGWICYEHLKVGVCALVTDRGRLLLVRRGTEPFVGRWSLPAGYVESDESPTAAVVRETLEETGVEVTVGELAGVFFFDDDPRGNGLLIAYHCTGDADGLRETGEAREPTFFAPEDVPDDLAGAGHGQAIHSWVRAGMT